MFVVMIVQTPFASSKMDPFIGFMYGENVLHFIVCDVVLVSHLLVRQNISLPIFLKIYLSNILQGSCLAAMGRVSARVDADGIVCVLCFFNESTVVEHVHRYLIVKKNPVSIKTYSIIIHAVRYLVKARAWCGIVVVIVFVVGLGVVLFFSVAIVCFVVNVHN